MTKIIEINGIIGFDVTAYSVNYQLREAAGEDVEINFSSDGGYISEGLTIFNYIYDYAGMTTARIIGMAASMASYIPLAAKKVIAKSNAIYMIHDAVNGVYGNSADFLKAAKILDGFSNHLADIFAKKSGKTVNEIRDLMKAESYFFGSEILSAGFVDEIEEIEIGVDAAKAKSRDDQILDAMMRFEVANQKLKTKPEDIKKIAAHFTGFGNKTQDSEPANSANQRQVAKNQKFEEEVKNMSEKILTLDEFLAENPIAKNEYDSRMMNAKTEAKALGIANIRADIAKVAPILNSASYDNAIKETAVDALNGQIDIGTFLAMVKVEDRRAEAKKSKDAADETPPDTPPDTGVVNKNIPKNPEDMKELAANLKTKI